jgi:hypothetical protein
MKKIYLREIRHIVANYSLKNKFTGDCLKSKSLSFKIIQKLIKQKLIECKIIDDGFMFVSPTQKLITAYGPIGIINKPAVMPELKKNWIWNSHTENNLVNSPVIAA